MLCKSIDELFQQGSDAVDNSALKGLVQKTGFSVEEILRKYIRYSLNEKPWSADLISGLIQLRKASMLDDSQIAEILNDISRRILFRKIVFKIADMVFLVAMKSSNTYTPGIVGGDMNLFYHKGPVVMDMSGFTEKGFKRKLAVQGLFGKVLYLSESNKWMVVLKSTIIKNQTMKLECNKENEKRSSCSKQLLEFCSRDSSLIVKEIFGVTPQVTLVLTLYFSEDADKLRLHTFSEAGDMDSLEKMVDGSNSEDSHEDSADAV
ncbi:hypothetical protein GOBAR_DD07407 [Gossypium barbadense]|nr:hypothetical protein GOBAR_DD07407 [Gossypium barbadense]